MALRVFAACVVLAVVVGCKKETAPENDVHGAEAVDASVPSKEIELTFLITGAENGYLLRTVADESTMQGGAAETLGRWMTDEGHPEKTIALSTGDNANGQSVSSYFKGESTAQVMKRMGYAASAFGNRELDWSREQFLANTKTGGFPYLAANLKAKDATGSELGLKPFTIVEKNGVKVGVLGLAARKSTWTPMPGRTAGLELVSDDAALTEAVPAARKEGADVLVLITDGCLHDVPELINAHADWNFAFVAGRDCERVYPMTVGVTKLVYPGRHWNEYARVVTTVDLIKPAAQKVVKSEVKLVPVDASAKADEPTREAIAEWKKKLDDALGAQIGFTKTGIEQDSAEMSGWLTTALKERFKTDFALFNRKGVRQGLPAGAITGASLWDLVPFDNQVVTVKVTGEQLQAVADNLEARVAGLKGKKLDPKKTYTLATTDYLYLGGDGFKLNEADANPTQTKESVQTALIEWTKSKQSSEKKPLETVLPK
ncbi:MAG: bifunctional metallophosphatase/5'-nucleotidase [Archangium sp.]